MQEYKSFWISGTAAPGPPYTKYWNLAGDILYQRADNSVVELARFTLLSLEFDDEGVAELFGLELARLVVDTSYDELVVERRNIEQRPTNPPHRR